jgi:hypothetical protein
LPLAGRDEILQLGKGDPAVFSTELHGEKRQAGTAV